MHGAKSDPETKQTENLGSTLKNEKVSTPAHLAGWGSHGLSRLQALRNFLQRDMEESGNPTEGSLCAETQATGQEARQSCAQAERWRKQGGRLSEKPSVLPVSEAIPPDITSLEDSW
eukprot:6207243-Amphidinium_carterae.1